MRPLPWNGRGDTWEKTWYLTRRACRHSGQSGNRRRGLRNCPSPWSLSPAGGLRASLLHATASPRTPGSGSLVCAPVPQGCGTSPLRAWLTGAQGDAFVTSSAVGAVGSQARCRGEMGAFTRPGPVAALRRDSPRPALDAKRGQPPEGLGTGHSQCVPGQGAVQPRPRAFLVWRSLREHILP